jgi:hypothetical protein
MKLVAKLIIYMMQRELYAIIKDECKIKQELRDNYRVNLPWFLNLMN